MGKDEPESWYKRKSDAESYASFYSTRRAGKFRAVPARGGGYTLKRVPRGAGVLARVKKSLAPSAKRGRAHVTRAVRKRIPKSRKSTTRRRRRTSTRKRRRRRR